MSNLTLKANSSDKARFAISPTLTESDKPVLALFAVGTAHKGASLGNTKNKQIANGALCRNIFAAIFKLAEYIFHNWERFYHLYLPKSKPKHVSGDVVFALAIKILGYEHLTTRENIHSLPTFVHMKGELQGVNTVGAQWNINLSSHWISPDNLVVGNFRQTSPFHYVIKDWLTEQNVKLLEAGIGL